MAGAGSVDDLELTDVLSELAANEASPHVGRAETQASESRLKDQSSGTTRSGVVGDAYVGSAVRVAQLECELASTKTTLRERERALLTEQRRVNELQEQLQQLARDNSTAETKTGANKVQNSFDIVLTLSGERAAAIRERKLYKDRAADAEANVARLESDLAAAYANASDTVATLRQLLQDRDDRIVELEMQLTDHAGAPTMVGGELLQPAAGTFPTVVCTLESLDTPGELHKLTRSTNTIGRSIGNDIPLNSSSVSRFHARLLNNPDGVRLVDLQSTNGCHVNGRRISVQILSEGDLMTIGECRFRFSAVTP